MKYLLMLPVKFYRKYISPHTPPTCRFRPSCSAYCIEALEKRGAIVGLGLTAWRILRCNPFSKGGYDPVPEKKHKRIVYPTNIGKTEKEQKDELNQ